MKRALPWAITSLLLLIFGCATTLRIQMNVKAYSDPEHPATSVRSFMVVPLGLTQGDTLLEKELLFLVKQRLLRRGLAYDEKDPDILVGLVGYIGPFERYVPPSTLYWPMPTTSTSTTTSTGMIGTTNVFGSSNTTTTGTQYVPITTPGYSQIQYYRNIQVVMGRRGTSGNDEPSVELSWSGIVESSGNSADLLAVAPYMLNELLGEFPQRTGKPTRRVVVWTPSPRN